MASTSKQHSLSEPEANATTGDTAPPQEQSHSSPASNIPAELKQNLTDDSPISTTPTLEHQRQRPSEITTAAVQRISSGTKENRAAVPCTENTARPPNLQLVENAWKPDSLALPGCTCSMCAQHKGAFAPATECTCSKRIQRRLEKYYGEVAGEFDWIKDQVYDHYCGSCAEWANSLLDRAWKGSLRARQALGGLFPELAAGWERARANLAERGNINTCDW